MSASLLKQPNTVKAVAAAALGAVLFGAEIGYWSQATSMVSFNRAITGNVDIEPSGSELTLLTCTLYIVGTIFALPPVTRIFAGGLGRRKTIMISGVLFAIAMAMQAASASIPYPASKSLLWAGRALLGVPVAFSVTTSPMFLSEISPKEHRGLITGMFQLTLTISMVIASGIGLAINTNYPDSDNSYQYAIWWMVPLGLCVSLAMYFNYESPQFLLISGKDEEAKEVVLYLRKGVEETKAYHEFESLRDEITEEKAQGELTLKRLFSGYTLRIVMIVIFMQFLQQFSGVNVLNNFAPKLYESVSSSPDLLAWIGLVAQFLGTIPSALLVDRLGRRPLLIFGAVFLVVLWGVIGIMGATIIHHPENCYKILNCPEGYECDSDARFTSQSMATENVCGDVGSVGYTSCSEGLTLVASDTFNLGCLYSGDGAPTADNPYPTLSLPVGYVFVAMTYVIAFIFNVTIGPIVWSYNAEIAPSIAQAQIVGLSAASNLFFNGIIVSPVIGNLIVALGFEAFWIFVVIMAVGAAFFYWIVETKDQSIAIITEKWEEKLKCEYTGHHHAIANEPLDKHLPSEKQSSEERMINKNGDVFGGENMEIDA